MKHNYLGDYLVLGNVYQRFTQQERLLHLKEVQKVVPEKANGQSKFIGFMDGTSGDQSLFKGLGESRHSEQPQTVIHRVRKCVSESKSHE